MLYLEWENMVHHKYSEKLHDYRKNDHDTFFVIEDNKYYCAASEVYTNKNKTCPHR